MWSSPALGFDLERVKQTTENKQEGGKQTENSGEDMKGWKKMIISRIRLKGGKAARAVSFRRGKEATGEESTKPGANKDT
jgi:hypothetical protein